MSTFSGRIADLPPGLRVDRFDDVVIPPPPATAATPAASSCSTPPAPTAILFLSHCHTDHMRGLQELQHTNHAADDAVAEQQRQPPLYLSAVSAVIVRRLFPRLRLRLVPMPIGEPQLISLPDGLTVTALPAGHCPGSVMFLFEVVRRSETVLRVLYTGDFRLNASALQKMLPFRQAPLPTIDALHLDSTFFSTRYEHFPTLRASATVVADLCADWLQRSRSHHVRLLLAARFGYEFLFAELARRLRGQPVHIDDAVQAALYGACAELDGSWSTGEATTTPTRVHACSGERTKAALRRCGGDAWLLDAGVRRLPCLADAVPAQHVRTIVLSAWSWRDLSPLERQQAAIEVAPQVFRVCYATHSSCGEIRAMLRLLRPRRVELNVLPAEGTAERRQMGELLAGIMREIGDEEATRTRIESIVTGVADEKPEEFNLSGIRFGDDATVEAPAETRIAALPKRRRLMEQDSSKPAL